jgi:hypothetical protein
MRVYYAAGLEEKQAITKNPPGRKHRVLSPDGS